MMTLTRYETEMTITDLKTTTTKLIGDRFKLFMKIDRCKSIYEHSNLHNELSKLNTQIDQYEKSIRSLQRIKRGMLK